MSVPYYADDWLTVFQGDCREVLPTLPEASVDCVVTSPPYWSLRDYSVELSLWGGDPDHDHEWAAQSKSSGGVYLGKTRWQHQHNGRDEAQPGDRRQRPAYRIDGHPEVPAGSLCPCGTWYGALGLEPTPELYVEHLVDVMRAVRRVLSPAGTLWLNLGDCYSGSRQGAGDLLSNNRGNVASRRRDNELVKRSDWAVAGLKPKDLVGIPWRAAFALQADGWWLRSDIIWSKPNPMPESVTDRPTRAHEYLFLLTRSERYVYDALAISEAAIRGHEIRWDPGTNGHGGGVSHAGDGKSTRRFRAGGGQPGNRSGVQPAPQPEDGGLRVTRNKRSVWTVPTRPYPQAHFATFPPALVEPCILAGTPPGGVVLDPFAGTGTVGMVAAAHSRRSILIDLNPDYIAQQLKRNAQTPLGLGAEVLA